MKNQNLKIKTLFLIILLCGIFGLAVKSYAATINAVSCSYTDVSAAINTASVGDTVNIPPGTCTWTNRFTITKGINLIGAGIDATNITANVANYCEGEAYSIGYLISYIPAIPANNSPFRLSGFTINQNSSCHGLSLHSASNDMPSIVQSNIRIDHIKFNNPDINYTSLWNFGVYGSVDNNIFNAAAEPIRSGTQIGNNYWWGHFANTWGSSSALYFEDNTFTLSHNSDTMIGDGNDNAPRMVYRYNNITANQDMYGAIDVHGNQGHYFYAGYGDDIYGNNISAGDNYVKLTYLRAGKSVVFNNNVTTSASFLNGVDSGETNVCPTDYVSDQLIHDTYIWRNYKNISASLSTMSAFDVMSGTCNGLTNIPTEGRDFYDDQSTPGVGCGTLANRPAICTTGQGYWATNQSCTNLTGMVGTNPTSPISGTLYKCTSTNNWTAFYTPYTYPHPLRGGSVDNAPPAPPTGIVVN